MFSTYASAFKWVSAFLDTWICTRRRQNTLRPSTGDWLVRSLGCFVVSVILKKGQKLKGQWKTWLIKCERCCPCLDCLLMVWQALVKSLAGQIKIKKLSQSICWLQGVYFHHLFLFLHWSRILSLKRTFPGCLDWLFLPYVFSEDNYMWRQGIFKKGNALGWFKDTLKTTALFLKGIFFFFLAYCWGFFTQISMFGFIWKMFLCLPFLGMIKGDLQIVAGNAEYLFIFLFSKFTYGSV